MFKEDLELILFINTIEYIKTSKNLLEKTYFFAKIITVQAKAQKNIIELPKTKAKWLILTIQNYII